jgi:hypothetical protein
MRVEKGVDVCCVLTIGRRGWVASPLLPTEARLPNLTMTPRWEDGAQHVHSLRD